MNFEDLKLVEDGWSTYPDPEFDPEWSELVALQWHLAVRKAYLRRRFGDSVIIPKIEIVEHEKGQLFATVINGGGPFCSYNANWTMIIDIFVGIEAVYSEFDNLNLVPALRGLLVG